MLFGNLNYAKELDVPDGIQNLIKHNEVKIYRISYFSHIWFRLESTSVEFACGSLNDLYEEYRQYANLRAKS